MRKFIVICFMSNDEYNDGHVVGSINIPYDEINENIFDDSEADWTVKVDLKIFVK